MVGRVRLQRRFQVERLADGHAQHPLFGDTGFAAAPDNRAGAALDLLATRRAKGPLGPSRLPMVGTKRAHFHVSETSFSSKVS